MKKIFTIEEIQELERLYTKEMMSTRALGERYGISDRTISKVLKENNIPVRKPCRRDLGGKAASDKRHAEKHKEKRSAYHKKWSKDNRQNLKTYHDQWRIDNVDKIRASRNAYEKKKKSENPHYKFAVYTRTSIWETLKTKRGTGIFRHMPYTVDQLIIHVESLFTPGMTWENYGEWHLDHIIPIVSFQFDSFTDLQFLECWELDNLQPLWATTRIIDGIKYIGNLNKNCR